MAIISRNRPLHILVVDDNPINRMVAARLLKTLQQWRAAAQRVPPVLMVTGNDLPSDAARFHDLGAKGLIPKPLTREALQRGLVMFRP